ncbi:MAG: PH domain-containing protein [Bacillota bacterium]|nr:PH domain-containing protein [Bacillota bacterium]
MNEERRCHFAYVPIRTLRTAWAALAAIVLSFVNSGGEQILERGATTIGVLLGLAVLLLAVIVCYFLRWRKTFISLEPEQLIIDRRTINKRRTTVRLSTIASVNLRQGVLERLFGVYRLQLDINSAATADSTDFDLIFSRGVALELRDALIAANDPLTAQAITTDAEQQPLISFGFGQVIRHCLLSLSIGSIFFAGVGALLWEWQLRVSAAGGQVSWTPVIIAMAPAVWQSLKPFFIYHHFRVRKSGEHVDISYGLISSQRFSLPLDKTNAIIIRRPALARLFGLCCGEMINVGMGSAEERQAPLFCLLVSERQMYELLLKIAPDYAHAGLLPHSPPRAVYPALASWTLLGLLVSAAALIFARWWLALLLPVALLSGYCQYRCQELALFDDKISISSGVFSKRNITVEYRRLQQLWYKTGPLARRIGVARGGVSILSSSASKHNSIGYFGLDDYAFIERAMLDAANKKR